MIKNRLKKAMAVIISTTMLAAGYSVVSAEDFTDMDAFVSDGAVVTEEAVETEEVQMEAQTEEIAETEDDGFFGGESEGFTDGAEENVESEAETETEAEETEETEAPAEADFRFENEEVIITATVSEDVVLPENTEMTAVKLEAGSEKYEEAKQASIRDLGTTEDDEYTFYDVTFVADGAELDLPDGAAVINMEFKDTTSDENVTESALHIQQTEEGTVAQDVTAENADGTLKSVEFNF